MSLASSILVIFLIVSLLSVLETSFFLLFFFDDVKWTLVFATSSAFNFFSKKIEKQDIYEKFVNKNAIKHVSSPFF